MAKAHVLPSEWKAASDLVKGRGGYRPHKKAVTRAEHRRQIAEINRLGDSTTTVGEANALLAVTEELRRIADRPLPTDPLRRFGIVFGEAGEAFKEALKATAPGGPIARLADGRYELIQTAAACVRVIGAMDDEERARFAHKPIRRKGPYRRRTTKV